MRIIKLYDVENLNAVFVELHLRNSRIGKEEEGIKFFYIIKAKHLKYMCLCEFIWEKEIKRDDDFHAAPYPYMQSLSCVQA